ncbi:MAG: site-2 protease family protein [Anaerolineae bacterium]|nr:site-2 protease family protein [Anaerolineae bacterium]
MLNEPSILASGKAAASRPAQTTAQSASTDAHESLKAVVAEVMDIYEVDTSPPPPAYASFTGRLRIDSEAAYNRLDAHFAPLDYHTLLTTDEQERHVIVAIKGRARPKARPWWPNALLFVLTVLSLLYTGAVHEAAMLDHDSFRLWEGLPYAVSMILILGTHEMGHYFAARHHNVSVTLPYFIPAPISFGTLGAFIQLREPMRNRKTLFDVGVAGPLAGLIVTIPILFIGLATSDLEPLPDDTYMLEGDSLFYATAKFAIFGELLPNDTKDVFINQLAKAGWTGLFITGLNLIPLGQLDGGHVVFTLLGKQARRLYVPFLTGFFVLSFVNPAWFLWTMILLLLGRVYAVPLDTITPLDARRRQIGYMAMMIFILVFVPDPMRIIQP